MTISWEELVKNRQPVPTLHNSAHMLECMKKVQERFPDVTIVEVPGKLWKLTENGRDLSGAHNSHYACWAEAMNVADH